MVRGMLKAAFLGLLLTYGIGLLYKYLILNFYLGTKTPLSVILLSCFPLDLPGNLVLCFLAAAIAPRLRRTIAHMQ